MTERRGLTGWLSPLVHLSNNWISLIGVVVVTTTTVLWLFLLPTTVRGEVENPYIGILSFMALPGAFFTGLILIPLGMLLRRRRERKSGIFPLEFPAINLRNVEFRRLVLFILLTTFVNIVIGSQVSYEAVNYMDSVTFCGRTCHNVMEPEFTAYQNSPHAKVECVKCHIGPGAGWFVRSKLSGVGQVIAVTFNTYERPIPTPVHNLRPARETCEACHWPQKYGEDRVRVIPKFADDEQNTASRTVLLVRIGGGNGGLGIHGTHLGEGVRIRYAHSDEKRQNIPWVEYNNSSGRKTLYLAPGTKPDADRNMNVREMDCIDCHNRPSHSFTLPERAVDAAMVAGQISPALPYARKRGVEILKASYPSREEAAGRIRTEFDKYYRETYPAVYSQRRAEVEKSGMALAAIYGRNIFPAMKIGWGTYPNNIGHTDFPGCFRCHDDQHASRDGRKIGQDCNACHSLLAMEEAAPKILSDLGVPDAGAPPKK
jgi:nitrate/TMAO reductase-like tetraheme cytochrome c subunit